LWLVSHEVITSGSPTEQFELCGSGTYIFRESGSPSLGAMCRIVTNPLFKDLRPGGTEPGGRARTSVAGGPGRLAASFPVWDPGAAPVIASGDRPGSWGYAPSPCGGHGGGLPGARPRVRSGRTNRSRWANKVAPSMAPPPLPCGAVKRPSPRVESSRGSGPRGGSAGARGGPLPAPRNS